MPGVGAVDEGLRGDRVRPRGPGPRNLAIHDRVYSDAGLAIVDGHMNAFLPKDGLEYVRLADGADL